MAAPEALWQNIESNLANAQVAQNKHRGIVVWLRRASAAAVVAALVATAAWFALRSPQLPSATDIVAERTDAARKAETPEIKPTILPEDRADKVTIEKVQRLTVASSAPRTLIAAETPDTTVVAPMSETHDMADNRPPLVPRKSNPWLTVKPSNRSNTPPRHRSAMTMAMSGSIPKPTNRAKVAGAPDYMLRAAQGSRHQRARLCFSTHRQVLPAWRAISRSKRSIANQNSLTICPAKWA